MNDAVAGVGSSIQAGLDKVSGSIVASEVFLDPIEANDRIVLTAATIERAGGFGYGAGGDNADNGGGGGGGGGTAAGRPVAAIEIGPDGVTVHPIIDVTRIGVTVLAAVLALFASKRRMRA